MATLNDTLVEVHDWSRERIHVLCEEGEKEIKRGLDGMMKGKKMQDDAFALFSEFEEWYDKDEEHDIFSLEYIGEGSEYD
tara:strand:+ start:69 stop:308 length:240 start_codon:yes stop_codon:yes gene_type:complete